ncbi:MAG: GH3 auxin-responsive promoter family protein, partial [Phycisphaerae bacterium]
MAAGKTLDKVMAYAARAHARRVLNRLLHASQEATALQERVLLQHIRKNAGSAYGADHGFNNIANYADFARQVPVSSYQDLAPYIQRVKDGDLSAMFGQGQRVHMFALTSGTTDEPKYIPVTDRFLADYRRGWNAFGVKALIDHPSALLKPIVQVTSPMDESTTSAGIPCGAITGLMASTQKRIVRRYYATPPCVGYIKHADARYYTIARLAMAGSVGFMITANPATHLRIARIADQHADRIIRDIRQGTLSPPGDVPQAVRTELEPTLQPDADRAAKLQKTANRTGRLLPKDVWDLGFIANWTGGTMGLYLQDFPEFFGSVPVRDIGLLASEGRMSIPIADGTAAGVLEFTASFFEFIPVEQAEDAKPTVLRSHQLEIGQEYLILLTTSAGFYRYNIHDQIRVVDFLGQAPMIEFLHKGSQVGSLAGEKITEQQAVRAFQRACQSLGVGVSTFVLAARWD